MADTVDWLASAAVGGVGPGTDLGAQTRESGWQGVLDHVSTWDPILFGPIIDALRADDEASAREAALGEAPKFEIPESYTLALNELKKRQGEQMPGYNDILSSINQDAAANVTGAQQLTSGPDAITAQANISGEQMARVQDLGARATQWEQQQQQQYTKMLQGGADLETQQFEYNDWLPWQIAKNEINSMRNAGQAAQASGADTMGAAGMNAASIFSA